MTVSSWLKDRGLWLVLLVGLALRLQLAWSQAYIHDEDRTAIPLASTISLTPGQVHLPIRGENHGALPAYVVKTSSVLFGTTPAGYRALHVLLGLATITLVSSLAYHRFGVTAARWTAALFAFNEYYLTISSRATAHVPHLLFVALFLYAAYWFVVTERAGYLYAGAVALGLAFYCKEHSALLLPAFALVVAATSLRSWLWRPHPYVAALAFGAIIAPDILWNLRASPATTIVAYSDTPVVHTTYKNHLARVGGIGFSPYPLMFYGRDAVQAASRAATGRTIQDDTPEYQSMNSVLGALLVGAVVISTAAALSSRAAVPSAAAVRDAASGRGGALLLTAFWFVFGCFTLIEKGRSVGRLDAASWIWVESTLVAATVVCGGRLAAVRGWRRAVVWTTGAGALVWASLTPMQGLARGARYGAEESAAAGSHLLQTAAQTTVEAVRMRPLAAVGSAATVGVLLGLALGIAAGWWLWGRRSR